MGRLTDLFYQDQTETQSRDSDQIELESKKDFKTKRRKVSGRSRNVILHTNSRDHH